MAFLCWLLREGCSAKDALPRGNRAVGSLLPVWGGEGQAWSNTPGVPHHEQSFNQSYGKEVVGVRGPPLILLNRGGGEDPGLESCVFSLNAGPKELLCSFFAVIFGQVATKVCWQDVSIDLLIEGLQLLPVHKDLEGDENGPQQRTGVTLPSCSVSPREVPLPPGPFPALTLSSSLLFRNGLTTL